MDNMMEYAGYHARIEYSGEDRCFVGKVFGIADTLVFDGQTVEELEEAFHCCVDDYLELCREEGRQPDREFKGSFNVRLSPELHRRAALAAEKRGISLNQYVLQALEAYEAGVTVQRETTYVVPMPVKQWFAQVEALEQNAFSQSTGRLYAASRRGGIAYAGYDM